MNDRNGKDMLVLLTGAAGKVGQAFLSALLAESRFAGARVRAFVHNRALPEHDRLEVVRGSMAERADVSRAMAGITHVVHLAAVKEDPDTAMDVSVKGMFWLLEAYRASPHARQFMLLGGDCSVGHIVNAYDAPVTESSPRRAYPGVYALSKVLEETMLEQYYVQYGIDGCCLRAPWIMEKDDFRYVLSLGEDQFGGPDWSELMPVEQRRRLHAENRVPLLLDSTGAPLKRNFVHLSDLVSAMLLALDNPKARQQLFNIAMDEPVDYRAVADHLAATRGLASIEVPSPYHSNWLDNAKAKLMLGWRPRYDLARLIDEAFAYQRLADDPRIVWYKG